MRLPLEFFARMDFQDTSFNYRCWKLEEWKNVIWNDETFADLGQRCGVTRIWHKANEAYNPTCTRRCWTGPCDFIFWGCISYNKKGPCDIWKPETIQEKKNAEKEPEHGPFSDTLLRRLDRHPASSPAWVVERRCIPIEIEVRS